MYPLISIIIIVFNMVDTLEDCIISLINQDYPREKYEIIIIDGGSTDGTMNIIKKYDVDVYIEKRRGRGLARNIGIMKSKGDIIAFIDADCTANKKWLKIHVKNHLKNKHVAAVCGSVYNPYLKKQSNFTQAAHFENFSEFDINVPKKYVNYLPTCNASFKKNILLNVGLFEEKADRLEDFLLSQKIIQNGCDILYDPKAIVNHYEKNISNKKYISLEIDYGKWYYVSQILMKKRYGRLPVNPLLVTIMLPSIIIMRICRQIYKLKNIYYKTSIYVMLIMIMGGLIWGISYTFSSWATVFKGKYV